MVTSPTEIRLIYNSQAILPDTSGTVRYITRKMYCVVTHCLGRIWKKVTTVAHRKALHHRMWWVVCAQRVRDTRVPVVARTKEKWHIWRWLTGRNLDGD
jgi:hypothetical protein